MTVNLATADLPKEGSHYDPPIALGLMAAIGANSREEGLICPAACVGGLGQPGHPDHRGQYLD